MNCREFWNTMPEIGGEADHSHLANCPVCEARLKSHRELATGLQRVAAGFHNRQAPPRIEARLLTSFRAYSGTEPIRTRGRWIPVLTWAAAFVAMLALGIFLVRERQPEAERSPVSHGVQQATLETPSQFEDFIPLPDSGAVEASENSANAASAGEDMDVVHVEVPRSAMLAAGLEVSADRAGEMVEADVMLGSDGVARAVRFLD